MKVAIVGSKGSGKSTIGKYLQLEHNYLRLPMAAPLKNMLSAMGLTDEQINGQFKEVSSGQLCGKTPRHAMQTLGTEWGRKLIGEDIWLNMWQLEAMKYSNVVADDVRFHNEVERIKELSGLIIRVRRPKTDGKSDHESELYSNTFKADIEIFNDGTIEELIQKVEEEIMPILNNGGKIGKEEE